MDQQVVGFDWKRDFRAAVASSGVVDVCPTFDVIHGLSGKWTVFVMMALRERSHRFGELRRLFPGISQRMLTQTLYDLQRDGLATRAVTPSKPPAVEYALSPLGTTLFESLASVLEWSGANHHAVAQARSSFDADEQRGLDSPRTVGA
jgi:DNA-binding HxlR family transcriptional regulator